MGPPNLYTVYIYICLKVVMVNKLISRWPKPLSFMEKWGLMVVCPMICYNYPPKLLRQRHPFFIDQISFELMQKTHLLQGMCTKNGPSKKRAQVFHPQASIVIFSVDDWGVKSPPQQSIWVPLSFSKGEPGSLGYLGNLITNP